MIENRYGGLVEVCALWVLLLLVVLYCFFLNYRRQGAGRFAVIAGIE